jgi:hypothetical protein
MKKIGLCAVFLLFLTFTFLYLQIWKSPAQIDAGFVAHRLTFSAHSDRLFEELFSSDGEPLASAGIRHGNRFQTAEDKTVSVWRLSR